MEGRASRSAQQIALSRWQKFIAKSLAKRLDPEQFESYAPILYSKHPLPPHKIKREQYGILFRVADRKDAGRISLSEWAAFENLLMKPDAEYEIAFRLFDVSRTGSVKYEDFRQLYELNKGETSIPFDWECEWAKLYIGGKKKRHQMDYPQFSQMLRGLQGERIRQAFQQFDRDGDGFIDPEDFERIILETSKHKLSDHLLQNLSSLCNITLGSKVSYANVRAFQNMIKEMDLVELIVRRAVAKSTDGKITRTEEAAAAARIRRYHMRVRLDCDPAYDRDALARAFADVDELTLEVWQAAFLGADHGVLTLFEGVRGVGRVRIYGSTTGFEDYVQWLRRVMESHDTRGCLA
ncbi:hypothetical protein BN1723_013125 [Verticillium longisporum]|uniref:EF-hand domain-containing protein n=1 Tax=Verticillium longisporum TaxID=100787 RepID=A0A0G4LP28_VERLO|nr:hypothetical protein BN1723_013125 [Verticillium longisporum]